MKPTANATLLCTSSAALALLAACVLPSRELGSSRERWTHREPGSRDLVYTALAVTEDDGVVLASRAMISTLVGGLQRYDADGQLRWSTPVEHVGATWVDMIDVTVAGDGTIVAAVTISTDVGATTEDVGWLHGFGPDGSPLWQRPVEDTTSMRRVEATPDGDVAFAASIEDVGTNVGRISTDGELGASVVLPTDPTYQYVFSLVVQASGHLVLVHQQSGDDEVVRLDAALATTWTRNLPDKSTFFGLALADDDTIHVFGTRQTQDQSTEPTTITHHNRIFVLSSEDGAVVSELHGIEPDLQPSAMALTADGTIVLVGSNTQDIVDREIGIAEIDPDLGETLWRDTLGNRPMGYLHFSEDGANDVVIAQDGDIVVAGAYDDRGSSGGWSAWLSRYAALPDEP